MINVKALLFKSRKVNTLSELVIDCNPKSVKNLLLRILFDGRLFDKFYKNKIIKIKAGFLNFVAENFNPQFVLAMNQ